MKNLKTFESFNLDEGMSKVERMQNYFEEDFLKQDFVKNITGKDADSMYLEDDYNLDDDTDTVWIELLGVDKKYIDEVGNDYDKFAAPFIEWAKKHNLSGPEILTGDDDSITFSVRKNPDFRR